jgi:hypothetical protein
VNVKLLLDENISPKVAEILRRDGIDELRDHASTEVSLALTGAAVY